MLAFDQVDVFSAEFTLGNPVAVVHGADHLTDPQLAAFARWTHLSETAYLLAPTEVDADYRLRIFTTARELPFAGHPTLGAARAWLDRGGQPRSADTLVQQCGAGLVQIRRNGSRLAFAAPPLLRSGPVEPSDRAEIADALGIAAEEIVDAEWADNGPGWVVVLLADANRVLSLRPHYSRFGRFPDIGVIGPHPAGHEAAFEVRAFVGSDDGMEDPATGSLNAAAAQWLIPSGRAPASYVAAQGTALGRRARIHVESRDGTIWVGGDTVIGIRGEVALTSG